MAAAGLRHGVTSAFHGSMKDAARREAALRRAGIDVPCRLLQQVHGVSIHGLTDGGEVPPHGTSGDGWILRAPGPLAAGVFVADCAPLFVWHPSGAAAGVFHAGWRGMSAGMARKAVEGFVALGFKASELAASIGPRIGPCCFKVGPEVAAQFRLGSVLVREGGSYVDLAAEARSQFIEAGLIGEAICASPSCTCCQRELLFSYRRDKQDMRMMAFVMMGGAS
jgi:YfiH family protein